MAIEKLPSGTRGARTPPGWVGRVMNPVMRFVHRHTGNRFSGMDLLYLTTVGARSGAERMSTVARFEDGEGGWFIVASAGGTAGHPAWYHNLVAHPDRVRAEVSGSTYRVDVEQLSGDERERAWSQIVARSPRFGGYVTKTDRQLPVIRLTPAS